MNEPTAFFELACRRGHRAGGSSGQAETAKFEMNAAELSEMMQNLSDIQKKIEEAS